MEVTPLGGLKMDFKVEGLRLLSLADITAQRADTLARWWNAFNIFDWPREFPVEKPEWYPEDCGIDNALDYVRPLMWAIRDRIGLKECLRWHWLHNLNRTNEQFEEWSRYRRWAFSDIDA